jgi:hypothetical protein
MASANAGLITITLDTRMNIDPLENEVAESVKRLLLRYLDLTQRQGSIQFEHAVFCIGIVIKHTQSALL